MTKYKYKNLKHVILHGIEPYGEKTFDHPIEGGGIELIEKIEEVIIVDKKKKTKEKELIEEGDEK